MILWETGVWEAWRDFEPCNSRSMLEAINLSQPTFYGTSLGKLPTCFFAFVSPILRVHVVCFLPLYQQRRYAICLCTQLVAIFKLCGRQAVGRKEGAIEFMIKPILILTFPALIKLSNGSHASAMVSKICIHNRIGFCKQNSEECPLALALHHRHCSRQSVRADADPYNSKQLVSR